MKRRTAVRVISFCVTAALIFAGFALKSRTETKNYRLQIQNGYSRSLEELLSGVNNISLILKKAEYTSSAKQLSNMAAQLLTESENAKNALSNLPNGGELTVLNRFLSQVGNYAMSVSKSLADGKENTEYAENIRLLKNTAEKISDAIEEADITYGTSDKWAEELDRKIGENVPQESLAGALGSLEESLSDYPTLVYDGPYSDHILEKEPEMIKNAAEISEHEALEKAAEITGLKADELTMDEKTSGKISVYRFSANGAVAAISCRGGYPVYMRKTGKMGDFILEYRQALDKAKRYLEKIGLAGFKETYYFTDEGVCVINFAYLDGRTVCYTDLVKVGVAMDSGEIMLLETSGYLSNHTDRAFESPAVTIEKAAEKVNKKLKIRNMELTLIPTDSGGEVRCYEFLCETEDEQEILIYINAVTGEEERILILLKSDGGTLVK